MRKVIKHGKYYQEKKEMAGIPYVECPECGFKIDVNLDYLNDYNAVMCYQCECAFSVEEEDIEYRQLRQKTYFKR